MMTKRPKTRFQGGSRHGFTMMETLIVIAIIAALATVILVVTGKIRKRAYQVNSLENLRTLSAGLLSAATESSGMLPAPYEGSAAAASSTWDWVVGRYLEEGFESPAELRQAAESDTMESFRLKIHKPIGDYARYSKAKRSYSMGNRYWVRGDTLTAETDRIAMLRVSRPSETIMMMEAFLDGNLRGMASRAGVNPINIPGDNGNPFHKKPYEIWDGGFQAAMFDGSIRWIKYDDFTNMWGGQRKNHGGWNYFSLGEPRVP